MKKFLALILALVMALALVACGGNNNPTPAPSNEGEKENTPTEEYKVAMVTDYGDITDQSFKASPERRYASGRRTCRARFRRGSS